MDGPGEEAYGRKDSYYSFNSPGGSRRSSVPTALSLSRYSLNTINTNNGGFDNISGKRTPLLQDNIEGTDNIWLSILFGAVLFVSIVGTTMYLIFVEYGITTKVQGVLFLTGVFEKMNNLFANMKNDLCKQKNFGLKYQTSAMI